MALVKMKDLLRRAEEKNIGCGAFSVGNMEMVRGDPCSRRTGYSDHPSDRGGAFEKFSASPDGTDDGTGCKGG